MRDIIIALIGASATLLAVVLKSYISSLLGGKTKATSYELLVKAYNDMMTAQRLFQQQNLELERKCYRAEEKIVRMEEAHKRAMREERTLNSMQHDEIVLLSAKLKTKDSEINDLKRTIGFIGEAD